MKILMLILGGWAVISAPLLSSDVSAAVRWVEVSGRVYSFNDKQVILVSGKNTVAIPRSQIPEKAELRDGAELKVRLPSLQALEGLKSRPLKQEEKDAVKSWRLSSRSGTGTPGQTRDAAKVELPRISQADARERPLQEFECEYTEEMSLLTWRDSKRSAVCIGDIRCANAARRTAFIVESACPAETSSECPSPRECIRSRQAEVRADAHE